MLLVACRGSALGKLAAAQVQRRREDGELEVRRASLWLSPKPGDAIRLPERPGTLVYGTLAALDADRWIELFKGEAALQGEASGPVSLDLRIGRLDAYGKRVHNVSLRAGGDAKGWSAALKADELAGEVTFTTEKGGALFARLSHLDFPEDSAAEVIEIFVCDLKDWLDWTWSLFPAISTTAATTLITRLAF